MIEYVRGKLVALSPGRAVLEVGATGIALEIPQSAESLEQQLGTEMLFYTRLLFREDEIRLIGFHDAEERDLFNLVT
ncbi:MAG: Holliday junction branch migration protein RuvA, partial [Firmicutes bacterium]|nr:Holliday junction branch migration protein RuvA [Bacillota bacterium]